MKLAREVQALGGGAPPPEAGPVRPPAPPPPGGLLPLGAPVGFWSELSRTLSKSGRDLAVFGAFLIGWIWLIVGLYGGGFVPYLFAAGLIGGAAVYGVMRLGQTWSER